MTTLEIVEEGDVRELLCRMRVFERAIAAQQTVIGQLGKDLNNARIELYELRQKTINDDSAVWTMFDGVNKEIEKLRRRGP